jgi:transcriptional regulator with XRE-family HTH domain
MKPREGFGARIRHERKRRGLSQTELALRLGLPPKTISRIENGAYARRAVLTEQRLQVWLDMPVTNSRIGEKRIGHWGEQQS